MYLQTSRLQYNLQGVVLLQTAFSKKYIRLSPYGNCTTNMAILQPARVNDCPTVDKGKKGLRKGEKNDIIISPINKNL